MGCAAVSALDLCPASGHIQRLLTQLHMVCLVLAIQAPLSQQKIANEREMHRNSRSTYSRIGLSAYIQGRVQTYCNVVLDTRHHQVETHLCFRCGVYEVGAPPGGVCVMCIGTLTCICAYAHHIHTCTYFRKFHTKNNCSQTF